MDSKEFFISECIRLAANGAGYVSPNPLVGCVIVRNNMIIGKGWHKKYGGPHAEVNAINDARKKGHSLKNAELYVNLEPCPHHGKTPPCTDLIIQEKIRRVFIGIKDPNKPVNGKGIAKLKKAGIKVEYGILENACRELNKFFIKSVNEKLPYVTLKIAQSIDGKIALDNNKSRYITGNESLEFVHTLRSEYDAVLIGKNTAKLDNPTLTVRLVKGRNPYRIVIDRNSKLSANLKLFTDKDADKTIVINSTDGKFIPFKNIIKALHGLGINSILVEGGAGVFSGFLKDNLFDDIYLITAPVIIGSGISPFRDFKITTLSEAKNIFLYNIFRTGNDLVLHYKK